MIIPGKRPCRTPVMIQHGEHLKRIAFGFCAQLVVRFCLGDVEEHFDALLAEEYDASWRFFGEVLVDEIKAARDSLVAYGAG